MVETSAGKKLSTARGKRGLSLDAAAHATKMRPDKILALENDDYTRFGSHAYAKGFLLIYSRYLGVDVSDQLRDLEPSHQRVSVEEYQYLNNAPVPIVSEPTSLVRSLSARQVKPPSVLPLVAFVALCLLGGAFAYVWTGWHRLELDQPSKGSRLEVATQPSDGSRTPITPHTGEGQAGTTLEAINPTETSSPVASASVTPEIEEPVSPAPGSEAAPAANQPEAAPADDGSNTLVVESLRKTSIKVRHTRNSEIVYENVIYPMGRPITVTGKSFYVEVKDPTAVQIRLNGKLVAYQSPGLSLP